MVKKTFNEVEEFVLNEWEKAIAFEAAMDSVRERAKSVLRRVKKRIGDLPDALDSVDVGTSDGGCIALGRTAWAKSSDTSIAGLWICYVGLDSLANPEIEAPYASIWGQKIFATTGEGDGTRKRIHAALKGILSDEEYASVRLEDSTQSRVLYWYFSSKHELLAALRSEDSSKFDDIVLKQVDMFVRMLPVVEPHLIARKNRK